MESKITGLSNKFLSIIVKLLYAEIADDVYQLDEDVILKSLETLNIKCESAKDISFIFELYKLNYSKVDEGTLKDSNIIKPTLKKYEVLYYEGVNEYKIYTYSTTVESYTSDRSLIEEVYTDEQKYDDSVRDILFDNEKYGERAKLLHNKRKNELIDALKKYKLSLRSDSKLCEKYIQSGIRGIGMSIDDIVERMAEMKYLFDYCNMRKNNKLYLLHRNYQSRIHMQKSYLVNMYFQYLDLYH